MNTTFLAFGQRADSLIANPLDKQRVLAHAFGQAAAYATDVPSSPVTNPESHYVVNVAAQVQRDLSCLNEQVIFDCRLACEFARSIWLLRYHAVHPQRLSSLPRQYGFFDSTLHVGLFVSEDTHKFVNEHKDAILALAGDAGECLASAREVNHG